MTRYFYSFYFDGSSRCGKPIITTSFYASSIRDANFMASCYCFVLASAQTPYCPVCFNLIKLDNHGK